MDFHFDTEGFDPDTYSPTVVDEATITNHSNDTVTRTVTVAFAKDREETTTWEHSFGVMMESSIESGTLARLVANVHFSLTIAYDYKWGGSKTVTKSTEFEETVEVSVGPNTVTTVKMVAYEQENAVIPFSWPQFARATEMTSQGRAG